MKKDTGKYLGSAMMVVFAAMALYRWQQTQLLFFLLLMLRDLVAAYFFLKRNPDRFFSSQAREIRQDKGRLIHAQSILAYLSTSVFLLYHPPNSNHELFILISNLLSIFGFFMVTLATIELGNSFGVSPANRGLVKTGIYRLLKHPMYFGYVMSEIGLVLVNPLNAIILLFSSSLYFLRSRFEEKALEYN